MEEKCVRKVTKNCESISGYFELIYNEQTQEKKKNQIKQIRVF